MVQILGLRDFVNRQGKTQKTTRFFNQGWRLPTADDIFDNEKVTQLLAKVPEGERYNLYFTVAQCFDDKERELQEQWYIPFDIDAIKFPDETPTGIESYSRKVLSSVASSLKLPEKDLGAIFSGHGVQIFVKLSYAIRSKDYFDDTREHYGSLCDRITKDLAKSQLSGKADPTVWSHARLMRMPGTINKKPDKTNRQAYILSTGKPKAHGYYLTEASGLKEFQKADVIPDTVLKQYPKPDSTAVLAGCNFLRKCKEKPKEISEPEWYAQISVTARLDNGRELTHQMSEGHPGYNFDETDSKIDQALKASGPRTCKDIATRWDGCKDCVHYGKITSPIMIRGEDYIATKDMGFRKLVFKEGQAPHPGGVAYKDLLKFFAQQAPYLVIEKSHDLHVYNGKYWEYQSEDRLKEWMCGVVKPEPSVSEMNEFCGRLYASHVHTADWFSQSRQFKMNFQNCVLDIRTMKTEPHNPLYGFLNILSFDYDPLAIAPRWQKFLQDSMGNDQELATLLEEYAGYSLSGDPIFSWGQKALILHGDGDNGKSIYLDVLGDLAGPLSCASIPVQALEKETYRAALLGKLFNKSEETAKNAFRDSQIFKAITGGAIISGRKLYKDAIEFRNTCKIIMSCNRLPYNNDNTHGFTRRLIIIPFNVIFKKGDPRRDENLYATLRQEMAGICNSVLAAYAKAKERQSFIHSKASTKEVEQYRTETDPINLFILEHCTVGQASEEAGACKDDIYQAYIDFCYTGNYKRETPPWFWRQVRKHVPDLDARSTQHRESGSRKRIVKGIKLSGDHNL